MKQNEKKCSVCKKIKNRGEFYKDKSRNDGLTYQCKSCRGIQAYNYRLSEKGQETIDRYKQTEKYKQMKKESERKYRQSENGKAVKKKYAEIYNKTQRRKDVMRRYYTSKKGKETRRKYIESRKELVRYWARKHYRSAKGQESSKRFQQSEKGRQNAKRTKATRRTTETKASGSYTYNEWYNLCKFYDFRCLKCCMQFPFIKLTVDHIKPVSKGGTSFIWNLQPLCKECNQIKYNKEIDYRKTLPDWIKRDGPMWIQSRLF